MPISQQAGTLPLTLTPDDLPVATPDGAGLEAWIEAHRDDALARLHAHGALLFRGFDIGGNERFEAISRAFSPKLHDYVGGNSPRTAVGGMVFTSTEYAKQALITQHNEGSNLRNMPSLLFFYSVLPATEGGGQTPLSGQRTVYERVDPEIRAEFEAKGVTYINNMHAGFGLGKSWMAQFQTEDRAEVDRICAENGYDAEWKEDGGLRTRITLPGVRRHPVTKEVCWTNQAELWHPIGLDARTRKALESRFQPEDFPRNATFGDGTPIPEAHLAHVREVLDATKTQFDWAAEDLLVVDNVLVAHGRQPFQGDRKLYVTLGAALPNEA